MEIVNNATGAEMDHTVSENAKDVMALENALFVAAAGNHNFCVVEGMCKKFAPMTESYVNACDVPKV